MAYVKKRMLSWVASGSPDVVGYVLRWIPSPGPIVYNPETNPGLDLGLVIEKQIPVVGMEDFDGDMMVGITAKDEADNESDPAEQTFPLDFQPPTGPTGLAIA